MFEEKFNQLPRNDRNQFAEAISDLLYECYIPAQKFDRKLKLKKVNPTYYFIDKYFSLVEEYLSFLSIVVTRSQEDGVIFITSSIDKNHLKTDSITTLIVYVLRSYYEGQLKERPEADVVMSFKDCVDELYKRELSTSQKRIPTSSIVSSLRTLDSFNIINRCKGTFSDNNFSFFILPTIKYIISIEKINYLNAYFNNETVMEENNNLFTELENESTPNIKQIGENDYEIEYEDKK